MTPSAVRGLGVLTRGPVLRLAVTAGILALALLAVDVGRLGPLFRAFEPTYFVLAVLAGALANAVGALTWRSLLGALGVRLSMANVARLYMVGLFFALVTPAGVAGDAVRTYRLHREMSRGVEGFASILVARVLSLSMLALLAAAAAMAILPDLVSSRGVALPIAVVGVALMLLALAGRPFEAVAGRIPWAALRRGSLVLLQHLGTLRGRPLLLLGASAAFGLHHLLVVLSVYLAGLALGLDIPFPWMLALVPLARVLTLMPLSVSGLGVQELAFVVLFKQVGVEAAAAFSLSLLSHVVLMAVPAAGGLVFLLGGRRREAAEAGQSHVDRTVVG